MTMAVSTTSPTFRVVLEPKAEPHDPQLYHADATAEFVEGFGALTERDLETYEERGFLIIRGGLTPDEVAAVKAELEKMVLADDPGCQEVYYEGTIRDHLAAPETDPNRKGKEGGSGSLALGAITNTLPAVEPHLRARYVRKFQGFVNKHPPLRAVSHKPELLALIERIAREPAQLFQDMAMIKPAGGREKPWHQDHAYFNFPLETRIVGVWIALGQVTPENGCMFVIEGGHKDGPRIHFKRRDWQLCDTEVRPLKQVALPMEAGDIMVFHAKLPHGTPTNRTQDYRWALQFHYVPVSAVGVDDQVRLAAFGSEGKDVTC